MQKILWLGEPYFAAALKDCGWETVAVHTPSSYEIHSWADLVRLAGFEPDVLVVGDSSTPPPVLGVENFPCLTVFYSVDSHIHSWHQFYAQAFDACLVSLKDHLPRFSNLFLDQNRIFWSPAFARQNDAPDPQARKIWNCLFVGTNDQALMPKRYAFLRDLASQTPGLQIKSGDYTKLFPQARVLVNQAERGDLNFRVFEAMGCGGCLVTPRIGHGLDKMFIDGEHYVGYSPNDAGDAAYRINFLLQNPELCAHIGNAALTEINARHRPVHRAQAFTDHLCGLAMQGTAELIRKRRSQAASICSQALSVLYLAWANELQVQFHKKAFLAAAHGKFGLNGIQS